MWVLKVATKARLFQACRIVFAYLRHTHSGSLDWSRLAVLYNKSIVIGQYLMGLKPIKHNSLIKKHGDHFYVRRCINEAVTVALQMTRECEFCFENGLCEVFLVQVSFALAAWGCKWCVLINAFLLNEGLLCGKHLYCYLMWSHGFASVDVLSLRSFKH